jgi:hypothetical protein
MASNLTYLPLDNIGINGVNTQANAATLAPEWLTKADNISFKESGRITFRKGFVQEVMPVPSLTAISSLGEYKKETVNGTAIEYQLFCGANNNIYKVDLTSPAAAFTSVYDTDITSNDWQFINFNDKLVALQSGHVPLTYNGTTWSSISNSPTGLTKFDPSCGTGYYGRIWAGGVTENKAVVYYSDTLIETEWRPNGEDGAVGGGDDTAAGYIDLATVWGQDEIVAIEPFYGQLVIFGKRNIVVYANPTDPKTNMALVEVIRGIGCVSRDTLQQVADDLFFLSPTGLRSLQRTTEKDNIPLQDLSLTVKDNIIRDTISTTTLKSTYIENEGLYVLSFVDIDITYVFDMKHITPLTTPRVTFWTFNKPGKFTINSLIYTESEGFLVGQEGGSIARYTGFEDKELIEVGTSKVYDDVISYTGKFVTTWIDLGEGVTAALLKKLKAVVGGGAGTNMEVKWDTDFGVNSSKALSTTLNPLGFDYFYGINEFCLDNSNARVADSTYHTALPFDYTGGDMCMYDSDTGFTLKAYTAAGYVEDDYLCHPLSGLPAEDVSPVTEYAGVKGLREYNIPLSSSAKHVQFTFTAQTSGSSTVLQDLTLLFKRGKIR